MRGDGASDCSKTPEVEIGRSSEISNMLWEGKGAVQDYAKVSNTGVKGKGGKSFCEQGEVKLRKLLGSAEPDKLRLVWIERLPVGRHPEVQILRESINAASKSELIRRWTMDERLHIISIEVTRCVVFFQNEALV